MRTQGVAAWLTLYALFWGLGLLVGRLTPDLLWLGVGLFVGYLVLGWWFQPEPLFVGYTLATMTVVGVPALVSLGGAPLVGGGILVDDLSRTLLALTGLLFPVVAIYAYGTITHDRGAYFGSMALIEVLLLFCFWTNHFLAFYIAFELLAFPMFFQVGRWGSTPGARSTAAFKFLIYTVIGSVTTLPAMMVVYQMVGSLNLHDLLAYRFDPVDQPVLALCFLLPFVVKLPVVPFHLWLVEAHVEAPAPSSMVLAALLLKTGGFGYLRFVSALFPVGAAQVGALTLTLAVVGVVTASCAALVQTDLKRMMAYSSVAHMGTAFAAMVVNTPVANQGAVYTMVAHGFGSAGLFAGIGVLYDRYHTRNIREFGGLIGGMPQVGILFFVLILANFGFPFTGSFVGEFVTLAEISRTTLAVGLALGVGVFLSLVYSVWSYNRVFLGVPPVRVTRMEDATPNEWAALFLCVAYMVVLGFSGAWYVGVVAPHWEEFTAPWS